MPCTRCAVIACGLVAPGHLSRRSETGITWMRGPWGCALIKNDEAELRFGDYRLSRRESRVLRDGKAIALTPKALDVLYHLASRPDRLVTKEELLTTVWPDVVVSD